MKLTGVPPDTPDNLFDLAVGDPELEGNLVELEAALKNHDYSFGTGDGTLDVVADGGTINFRVRGSTLRGTGQCDEWTKGVGMFNAATIDLRLSPKTVDKFVIQVSESTAVLTLMLGSKIFNGPKTYSGCWKGDSGRGAGNYSFKD